MYGRSNIDQSAEFLLAHDGKYSGRADISTHQIDLNHLSEIFNRLCRDFLWVTMFHNPGSMDEYIDSAVKCSQCFLDCPIYLVFTAYITGAGDTVTASREDFIAHLVIVCFVPSPNSHSGACRGKGLCDSLSNALIATCDNSNFSCYIEHWQWPPYPRIILSISATRSSLTENFGQVPTQRVV